MLSDSASGATAIFDLVRCMAVCQNMSVIAKMLLRILASPKIEILRCKDRFEQPALGWRDVMINFRIKGSQHVCEIQIPHEKMTLQREEMGLHDEYDELRNATEIIKLMKSRAPGHSADY